MKEKWLIEFLLNPNTCIYNIIKNLECEYVIYDYKIVGFYHTHTKPLICVLSVYESKIMISIMYDYDIQLNSFKEKSRDYEVYDYITHKTYTFYPNRDLSLDNIIYELCTVLRTNVKFNDNKIGREILSKIRNRTITNLLDV